jgi:flagellar hook-basal body complex protein FliE
MAALDPIQAMGDIVKLARTSPLHIAGAGDQAAAAVAGGGAEQKFATMLFDALGNVNDTQVTAMNLSQQMITDPSSVNVEDVTVALASANLTLSMTKAIVDRALAAYREIINVR